MCVCVLGLIFCIYIKYKKKISPLAAYIITTTKTHPCISNVAVIPQKPSEKCNKI